MRFCLFVFLLLTVGCETANRRRNVERWIADGNDPNELAYLKPEYFSLPRYPQQECFESLLADSESRDLLSDGITREIAYASFFTMLSAPIVERPEYWVSIINDERRTDLMRLHAFRAFFLRHVKIGYRLGKLAEIPGTSSWFSSDTVHLVGGLGGTHSLEWRSDEQLLLISFQSELEEARLPITLSLKGGFDVDAPYDEIKDVLLGVLLGKPDGRRIIITGVAVD